MGHLGVVLYEYLGEEYPDVLGAILGALKAIVNVIGMTKMTPPIKDLLPRLSPILKNRHEAVQENCIDLVGRIADRGAEFVSAKEWMRICFELLDMLKAHKKAIRRATVNTFGYIAKAIGPQDVLATLLNNLKVQERQNRVCTTVAIAIVAETCSPFTVLPGLLNEYRIPELNVQNGVLKSLSFLFEYIGEMGRDYIYAVVPLLEDALTDRDLVHRQTACTTVKHMALGAIGLGVRGRDGAPAQPHLAQHLRDVAPRDQRRHGGDRGDAMRAAVRRPRRRLSRRAPEDLLCSRASSTPRARCATSTGRSTTTCTSARGRRSIMTPTAHHVLEEVKVRLLSRREQPVHVRRRGLVDLDPSSSARRRRYRRTSGTPPASFPTSPRDSRRSARWRDTHTRLEDVSTSVSQLEPPS